MTDNFSENDNLDNENEDFAAMLEASLGGVGRELTPGDKIEGTILQIGSEWTFLDVSQKGEGVLASAELLDADGEPIYSVGDRISVYFLTRTAGELRFTTRIGGTGSGSEQLEQAYLSQIPVDGRIDKEIKGGFEVTLSGNTRAFCPFSQTGLRQTAAEDLIGQSLPFRITQFSERGRNIVVSHRVILEEQRAQQREELRQHLKEGMLVSGEVTSLQNFGAFVDIGGIEGLLPVSEISYGRVENVADILTVGQNLNLSVKRIDWENNKFSFSLRDTLSDPWIKVGDQYRVGGQYTGKVSRLAPFGAFVTLEDGIDGLLHISKLGDGKKIRHPQDVLKVGQEIKVVIETINQEDRRIALAQAGHADDITETNYSESPASSGLGTLGDLLKQEKNKPKHRKGR